MTLRTFCTYEHFFVFCLWNSTLVFGLILRAMKNYVSAQRLVLYSLFCDPFKRHAHILKLLSTLGVIFMMWLPHLPSQTCIDQTISINY